MEQEQADVKVDPSTTVEPSVTQEAQSPVEPADSQTAEPIQAEGQGQPQKSPVDGINVEEVARHVTRFLAPQLKQQLDERLAGMNSQPAQPNQAPTNSWQSYLGPYTDEQIDAWADENPQYKPFARTELNRRIEERTEQRVLSKITTTQKKQTFEQEQQTALGYIAKEYSDAFTEVAGQKLWNTASPIYQRAVALYNSRPTFKEDGWGLAAAFDMVYGQMAREEKLNLQKDKSKIIANQRKQDKIQAQAIASGGKASPSGTESGKSKLTKLQEEFKRDPTNQKVKLELMKAKGLIPADMVGQ